MPREDRAGAAGRHFAQNTSSIPENKLGLDCIQIGGAAGNKEVEAAGLARLRFGTSITIGLKVTSMNTLLPGMPSLTPGGGPMSRIRSHIDIVAP